LEFSGPGFGVDPGTNLDDGVTFIANAAPVIATISDAPRRPIRTSSSSDGDRKARRSIGAAGQIQLAEEGGFEPPIRY
jgi:hypothetical protein